MSTTFSTPPLCYADYIHDTCDTFYTQLPQNPVRRIRQFVPNMHTSSETAALLSKQHWTLGRDVHEPLLIIARIQAQSTRDECAISFRWSEAAAATIAHFLATKSQISVSHNAPLRQFLIHHFPRFRFSHSYQRIRGERRIWQIGRERRTFNQSRIKAFRDSQ